jgi:Putative metal-binding motif
MRALALVLLGSSCFSAWNVSGPWACSDDHPCPSGLTCDDGLCCVSGGSPACPTLPIDGGCPTDVRPFLLYADRDGDGDGDPATGRLFCATPVKERWVIGQTDCDDGNAAVSPSASERCNAVDDDCDGVIDNGTHRTRWFIDEDGDGYGHDCDAGCVLDACAQPVGYASRSGDCAPVDADRHPGAPERCNDIDDNCNGLADDPPFSDVENGVDGGASFDCTPVGQQGQCANGGVQCVFDPVNNRFSKVCVPRLTPQPELCGDGVDNDCDGLVDNPPGCGGPSSLIAGRGSVTAQRFDRPDAGTPSGLPARCLGREPGGKAMAWLNPSWVGSGGALHVWSLAAPPGLTWDLSAPSTKLLLDLKLPFFINPGPGAWGGAAWFPNPVVTVCGARAGEYSRLYPTASSFDGNLAVTLPLWSPASGWAAEQGPIALDRRHVSSLEVAVSPVPPATGTVTFTLVFTPDAGFR